MAKYSRQALLALKFWWKSPIRIEAQRQQRMTIKPVSSLTWDV
jgi:hypothetical protein